MPRRSAHSREELRALVVQAARTIVVEEGLSGLTARKVARAVGYAVGSLYLVFENQDDIILHLNAHTLDDLYAFVCTEAAPQEEAAARILALGHAYLHFAQQHSRLWQAVFEYRHPADPMLPEWYQSKIVRLFKLIEEPLGRLMSVSDPHRIAQAARALWGGVHGICLLAFSGKLDVVGADSVQELLNMLIHNYLAGLQTAA